LAKLIYLIYYRYLILTPTLTQTPHPVNLAPTLTTVNPKSFGWISVIALFHSFK